MQKHIFFTCLLFCSMNAFGQESEMEEEEELKHHTIVVGMGHAHIPKATEKSLIVPSWTLNYNYWVNHKWAAFISNEIEISTYVIETSEEVEIERERPYSLVIGGMYKPIEPVTVLLGIGREFEKHENFWVYRIGLGYEIFATEEWELGVEVAYDIKEDVFDAWNIGLGVGRKF